MVKVKSHILEKCIAGLMILLGIAAAYIAWLTISQSAILSREVAIIEILIILVIAILAQSIILIKIYEQHDVDELNIEKLQNMQKKK